MRSLSAILRKYSVGVLTAILIPLYVFAITGPTGGDNSFHIQLVNPLRVGTLAELLDLLLTILIQLGIPVIVAMIVWSGFLFIKAQGNPGKVTEAKNNLLYVLIGTAIVLGVGSILVIIKATVAALGAGV